MVLPMLPWFAETDSRLVLRVGMTRAHAKPLSRLCLAFNNQRSLARPFVRCRVRLYCTDCVGKLVTLKNLRHCR